jgi:hypothetical protein
MIHRLVLDIPTTPGSDFQWQTDYKTGEYIITRNGRPVLACTTRQERDDVLDDLQGGVMRQKKEASPARPAISQTVTIADLWGE